MIPALLGAHVIGPYEGQPKPPLEVVVVTSCIKTKEAQVMLNVNIKNLRKAKGLSQEELAIKLNVVRQTVSKWEKGLSVPDSNLLISLADELDTSVSILLGETVQRCV